MSPATLALAGGDGAGPCAPPLKSALLPERWEERGRLIRSVPRRTDGVEVSSPAAGGCEAGTAGCHPGVAAPGNGVRGQRGGGGGEEKPPCPWGDSWGFRIHHEGHESASYNMWMFTVREGAKKSRSGPMNPHLHVRATTTFSQKHSSFFWVTCTPARPSATSLSPPSALHRRSATGHRTVR